jgi:TP901-1 family phage major tail protein
MAQPTTAKFGKMIVSLGDSATPPVYAAPCGLSTKSFTISKNLQEITIPDCDDPDAVMWVGRDAQSMTATVSGDGVAAAESVPDWNAAAVSTESVPMKVEIEFSTGTKSFTGLFQIDNLTFGAEAGGRVTLSFNAQSDGEIADLWTPIP